MKNILLLAHDDIGQEARLQAALDVTRAMSGHLTCLDAIMLPAALGYGGYGGSTTANLLENERQREALNRRRIERRLAHEDVAWSWKESIGLPEAAIRDEADLADLIVLSSDLDKHEPAEIRNLSGRVADKARRAILAVPSRTRGLDLSGTVLVAWDGSREASEALRDAVPLLQLADHVVLLDLDDPQAPFSQVDAAAFLSRNDIHARIRTAQCEPGETLFHTILEKARDIGASYIVMGAFGHSPAIEAVFGGVTRSMLDTSEIPLLLAH